jgi:quercetin dioxygenase-like cupin family protein
MNKHSITSQPAPPIPADSLERPLKVARPNTDQSLPHIGLVGDTYTVLLSGVDTNGRYCLIDMHIPPGGGPPPHRHDFEESFTLLEGEIEATFRGEKSTVRMGETLSIPANAPHSFTNASKGNVRLLCLCAPAGQEEFFAQVGVAVPTRTTTPPKLDEAAQSEFIKKAQELAHLEHHDVTLLAISRAPLSKLQAYKKRMGWRFKWVSSFGSDFNFD